MLACAEESEVAPLTRVAERTGVPRETVRKWRDRFLEGRMGLPCRRASPPGAAEDHRRAGGSHGTRTLMEKGPGQDSHWSTRAMAAEARAVPVHGVADLAGLRAQAPRRRDLEAQH